MPDAVSHLFPHAGPSLADLLSVGLLFSSLSFAAAVALVVAQHILRLQASRFLPALVYGVAVCLAGILESDRAYIPVFLIFSLVVSVCSDRTLRGYTSAGKLLVATNLQLMVFGLAWGIWFIGTIPISTVTRVLMFGAFPLLVLMVPAALVQSMEQWEVFCRGKWSRPRSPLCGPIAGVRPKVSLHVPVCSEPPDVVIATLNALSRIRYDNLEVLVVDNNTSDAALWRPVEQHCRDLGDRFRFFHLERWPGAKAGALNFALGHTAPEAEVIGVVDSDYQAESDFLEKLVGYFDDPAIGFVQSPHAYRGWDTRSYLRMCAREYRYFFETTMVSLNEYDAGITVGTMCLIRRRALEEAGGWAEWCATEDSELAIRIHALGYSSVYVNEVFGRGLIPETFADYKRQRFRWTSGPVQELKHHFRLFLPKPLGRPSALSLAQKLHHLNHGLDRAAVGLRLLLAPVVVAVIASMIVHQEIVQVPFVLWLAASVSLAAEFIHWWLAYRVTIRCSIADTIGALIASKSLYHTITISSLLALFNRQVPWRRTSKFKARPSRTGLLSAWPEATFGLCIVLFVACAFADLPQHGLLLMFLLGGLYYALNYLSAPALAFLAERDLRSSNSAAEAELETETGITAV